MPRRRKRSSRGVIRRRRRRRFDSGMIGSVLTHRHVSFPSHSRKSQLYPITTTKVRRYPRSLERIHNQIHTQTKKDTTDANSISTENNTVKEKSPVLIYVHGGSWRVGHRRAWLFSGQHPNMAEQYDCKVVSVGYRRCRMRPWVFYGLYPAAIYTLALGITIPIVLPFTLFHQDAKLNSEFLCYMSLGPAVLVSLIYYLFWGLYPRGGNWVSTRRRRMRSCKRRTRRARTMLPEPCDFLWPCHEYGLDMAFYLVGHSAGAHISSVATNPKFLTKYDLDTVIQGVAGLAGPYHQNHTTNWTHRFDGSCTLCRCTVHSLRVRGCGTKRVRWFRYPATELRQRRRSGVCYTERRICPCLMFRWKHSHARFVNIVLKTRS